MATIHTFSGKEFAISTSNKGFLAHELGGLTDWAKVTGNGERKAYRINPERTAGNQYGRYRVCIPYKTELEAIEACKAHSMIVIVR